MADNRSVKKYEPVKDLLGNINKFLIQRLQERTYGSDASSFPAINYLAAFPKPIASSATYEFGSELPETSVWLETLSGPESSWLRAPYTDDYCSGHFIC